jgi:plastocyanin
MLTRILRHRTAMTLVALTTALLASGAVAAFASPAAVKVADNYFGVKRLTVRLGARVTWKWTGVLNHNVTVKYGPARFRSRTQARGSFSQVFTRAGTYSLYCTIHRFMKMTVVVR